MNKELRMTNRTKVHSSKFVNHNSKSAFSLIEILVTLGILGMVIGLSVPFFRGGKSLDTILDNEAGGIVSLLRTAQEKSAIQENQNTWGVHFERNTDASKNFAALFEGGSYPTSSATSTKISLDSQIRLSLG